MDENVATLYQVKHEDDDNNDDDGNELSGLPEPLPQSFPAWLDYLPNSNVIETMKLCISLKKSRYR